MEALNKLKHKGNQQKQVDSIQIKVEEMERTLWSLVDKVTEIDKFLKDEDDMNEEDIDEDYVPVPLKRQKTQKLIEIDFPAEPATVWDKLNISKK